MPESFVGKNRPDLFAHEANRSGCRRLFDHNLSSIGSHGPAGVRACKPRFLWDRVAARFFVFRHAICVTIVYRDLQAVSTLRRKPDIYFSVGESEPTLFCDAYELCPIHPDSRRRTDPFSTGMLLAS